jgi:FkbM family methyltransferase
METIRRIARQVLGYNSSAYRAASSALTNLEIVRKEGFGMLATVKRLGSGSGPAEPVSFRNLDHPIDVRPGTNDINTVLDTVVREEYGKHLPNKELLTLIDAGAFIGDTSAYFLSRFPRLRTWALEPSPDNLPLTRINVARYGDRATVLPLALAGSEGTVHFAGKGTGGSIADQGYAVKTTTVPALLALIPGGRVDVLKIDIEGAEMEVFASAPATWMSRVGLIIVELHGPEIESSVLVILKDHNFQVTQYRSVWYCEPSRPSWNA